MTTPARGKTHALVLALAGALLVAATASTASAEPSSVAGKQAEAQRVLAQIREIDSRLSKAAEAYNLATIELDRIRADQRRNERMLVLARTNLGRAQSALARRLVALYTSDSSASAVEVVLGATSLDDLLSRLDTVDRVSAQDAEVLAQVKGFRNEVQQRKAELARARREQARVVAARAAQKAAVERRLAERQALLATIRSEIERLQAAERARQAELERQARARLRAQSQSQGPAEAQAQVEPASVAGATEVEADAAAPGAAPAARYGGVVGIAMRYLGVPYKWGGASPSTGFDCSGFVMYVFAQVGVSLPHNAAAQYGYGTAVSRSQLQPGDLVFFDGLGHNGIYIGGGQFIHAPHSGDVVKISSITGWYASRWVGARRL